MGEENFIDYLEYVVNNPKDRLMLINKFKEEIEWILTELQKQIDDKEFLVPSIESYVLTDKDVFLMLENMKNDILDY